MVDSVLCVCVKVVEVKQEPWRSVILAVAPVFKCVCSSSVPASFSKCSRSVQNAKARENVSTRRIGVKSVRVAKSPAIAKCLKFTLTKVLMADICTILIILLAQTAENMLTVLNIVTANVSKMS